MNTDELIREIIILAQSEFNLSFQSIPDKRYNEFERQLRELLVVYDGNVEDDYDAIMEDDITNDGIGDLELPDRYGVNNPYYYDHLDDYEEFLKVY